MQARCPSCNGVFPAERAGTQFCPHCGKSVVVPPFPAAVGEAEPTPWERRGELGWVQGWWQTWKAALFKPQEFWPRLKPDGSAVDALLYAWLNVLLSAGPLALMMYLTLSVYLRSGMLTQIFKQTGNARGAEEVFAWLADRLGWLVLGEAVVIVLFYPLGLLIGSAITHLFGLLYGCAKGGYGATFRVYGYASSGRAVSWVPVAGSLVGLYELGLVVFGLSRVHSSTVGRAVGAVLTPVAVICCCGGAGYVALVAMMLSAR